MTLNEESVLDIATEWLRGYARTYLPSDSEFSFSEKLLLACNVTLLDLRYLFRHGIVIQNEKLDEPGAIWRICGTDCDGFELYAEIHVISESLYVRLVNIERTRGDGNDYAA